MLNAFMYKYRWCLERLHEALYCLHKFTGMRQLVRARTRQLGGASHAARNWQSTRQHRFALGPAVLTAIALLDTSYLQIPSILTVLLVRRMKCHACLASDHGLRKQYVCGSMFQLAHACVAPMQRIATRRCGLTDTAARQSHEFSSAAEFALQNRSSSQCARVGRCNVVLSTSMHSGTGAQEYHLCMHRSQLCSQIEGAIESARLCTGIFSIPSQCRIS